MGVERRSLHAWVPEGAIYDERLGEAFRVFCCLLVFADKEGHCFVKVRTIAALLGKARSTVSEHLSTLERLGYIARSAQFRDDGGKRENRYWVARDGLPDTAPPVGLADVGVLPGVQMAAARAPDRRARMLAEAVAAGNRRCRLMTRCRGEDRRALRLHDRLARCDDRRDPTRRLRIFAPSHQTEVAPVSWSGVGLG